MYEYAAIKKKHRNNVYLAIFGLMFSILPLFFAISEFNSIKQVDCQILSCAISSDHCKSEFEGFDCYKSLLHLQFEYQDKEYKLERYLSRSADFNIADDACGAFSDRMITGYFYQTALANTFTLDKYIYLSCLIYVMLGSFIFTISILLFWVSVKEYLHTS